MAVQYRAFPADLSLKPLSRRPLVLPEATTRMVLGRDVAELAGRGLGRRCDDGPPVASVIVVTYNKLACTRLCLESLLLNTARPAFELIVVDNASTDGTPAYLRELERHVRCLRVILNGDNRGFAVANNQGLAQASSDVMVLLNNDTIVPPGWLSPLIRHAVKPDVGLVGPVTNRSPNEAEIDAPYSSYGEFDRFATAHTRAHAGRVVDLDTVIMFCLAMRREVYERLGPLDEQFGVGLLEDDDYSHRAHLAGFRTICAEDVFVHHFGQASFGDLFADGEYMRLLRVNQERYLAKWGRPWEPHHRRSRPAYDTLVEQLRTVIRDLVPSDARLVVVSKGDDRLLELDARQVWHFPRAADGAYAGYYPADSPEAIAHLEVLRTEGAGYFLLPASCFWWLDYYAEFAEYLTRAHQVLLQDERCLLVALRGQPGPGGRVVGLFGVASSSVAPEREGVAE